MFNCVILIGRVVDRPRITNLDSGMVIGNLTLAVTRSYKNQEGNYDTDFINCVCWNAVATSAFDNLKKGSVVCVKGLVQNKDFKVKTLNENNEEVEKRYVGLELNVEKITYIKA